MTKQTFTDENGTKHDFEAAAVLMDDELREAIHLEGFDTAQSFIEEYARRHHEKFAEDFTPFTGGNW